MQDEINFLKQCRDSATDELDFQTHDTLIEMIQDGYLTAHWNSNKSDVTFKITEKGIIRQQELIMQSLAYGPVGEA